MRPVVRAVSALAFAACVSQAQGAAGGWVDPAPHRVRVVQVAPDVHLEILDWGGQGEPVVLLAGLSNSAHVYDDFAPGLTDRFRVYGITRRGHGASSQPPDGYDVQTLAHDVVRVLDSLGLAKAHLVGHSLGGQELTALAHAHPERILTLVYLDAAYDHTGDSVLRALPPVPSTPPAPEDFASPQAVLAYVERVFGNTYPEAEVRAVVRFDSAGRGTGEVTSPRIRGAIMQSAQPQDFAAIRAPVLAIHAIRRTPAQDHPLFTTWDPADQERARVRAAGSQAYRSDQIARLRRALPTAHIVEIDDAHHYVFLSHEAQVLHLVRDFLAR